MQLVSCPLLYNSSTLFLHVCLLNIMTQLLTLLASIVEKASWRLESIIWNTPPQSTTSCTPCFASLVVSMMNGFCFIIKVIHKTSVFIIRPPFLNFAIYMYIVTLMKSHCSSLVQCTPIPAFTYSGTVVPHY